MTGTVSLPYILWQTINTPLPSHCIWRVWFVVPTPCSERWRESHHACVFCFSQPISSLKRLFFKRRSSDNDCVPSPTYLQCWARTTFFLFQHLCNSCKRVHLDSWAGRPKLFWMNELINFSNENSNTGGVLLITDNIYAHSLKVLTDLSSWSPGNHQPFTLQLDC